jgi:hypothetical protein
VSNKRIKKKRAKQALLRIAALWAWGMSPSRPNLWFLPAQPDIILKERRPQDHTNEGIYPDDMWRLE